MMTINKKDKIIYPEAGLANRLQCLYSALYWKKVLGLNFTILWEIDYACCIKYEKLFMPIPDVHIKTVYTLSLKNDKSLKSCLGKLYIQRLKKKVFCDYTEKLPIIYYNAGEEAVTDILSKEDMYCIKANSPFADWNHISEVLNEIKPTEEIEMRVRTILDSYQGKHIIGVHIRRTDNKDSIQHSPIRLFAEKMRECLDNNPDVVFYLATDDKEVEKEMSAEFPTVTHICFSDEKSRRTEAGMKDAYVDMLCLSRCEKIYGSYGSTFSKMASVIGGIECEIVYQ